MDIVDAAFLMFGQLMPSLDGDMRMDITDALNQSEYGVAIRNMLTLVDRDSLSVDHELVTKARELLMAPA